MTGAQLPEHHPTRCWQDDARSPRTTTTTTTDLEGNPYG